MRRCDGMDWGRPRVHESKASIADLGRTRPRLRCAAYPHGNDRWGAGGYNPLRLSAGAA